VCLICRDTFFPPFLVSSENPSLALSVDFQALEALSSAKAKIHEEAKIESRKVHFRKISVLSHQIDFVIICEVSGGGRGGESEEERVKRRRTKE
jgi:hypothetical protein